MKISELARKTGITIKTLRHYDKIGLLIPKHNKENGYRIYTDEDFFKLEQIATLKFIGMSLKEIKELLDRSENGMMEIIKYQKNFLEEKNKNIEAAITILSKAEEEIETEGIFEREKMIDIIKLTNYEYKVKKQYAEPENFISRLNLHRYNINKENFASFCLKKFDIKNHDRVLEIGCGTGELWQNAKLTDKDIELTLSDFSKDMLERAKINLSTHTLNINYKEADVQSLPFADGSFDVVIARHMLYLVPDIDKALVEMKRVLSKGGRLYITVNSNKSMKTLNDHFEKFDSSLGLHNGGMSERFHYENGRQLLAKKFDIIEDELFEGEIVTDDIEAIIDYKASTIKGREVIDAEKKEELRKYFARQIEKNGEIHIKTCACIFKITI